MFHRLCLTLKQFIKGKSTNSLLHNAVGVLLVRGMSSLLDLA